MNQGLKLELRDRAMHGESTPAQKLAYKRAAEEIERLEALHKRDIERNKEWKEANERLEDEVAALQKDKARLKFHINQLLPLAEDGLPDAIDGHVCGPEAHCDVTCQEAARGVTVIEEACAAIDAARKEKSDARTRQP